MRAQTSTTISPRYVIITLLASEGASESHDKGAGPSKMQYAIIFTLVEPRKKSNIIWVLSLAVGQNSFFIVGMVWKKRTVPYPESGLNNVPKFSYCEGPGN